MENEKRLEDALSDVKAELSELKMALNEITDRYDTYWNLNMTEAIKFYRGDTGNKVGEASCRVFLNMIGSCGLCVLQECIAKVQRIFVKVL